jgi:hypothetical protein
MHRHFASPPAIVLAAAIAVLGGSPMTADIAHAAPQTIPVSLGTATPGGGFPVYGVALAETINETDPSPRATPRAAPRT